MIPSYITRRFHNPFAQFCTGILIGYMYINSYNNHINNKSQDEKVKVVPDISYLIDDKHPHEFDGRSVAFFGGIFGSIMGTYYPITLPLYFSYCGYQKYIKK